MKDKTVSTLVAVVLLFVFDSMGGSARSGVGSPTLLTAATVHVSPSQTANLSVRLTTPHRRSIVKRTAELRNRASQSDQPLNAPDGKSS